MLYGFRSVSGYVVNVCTAEEDRRRRISTRGAASVTLERSFSVTGAANVCTLYLEVSLTLTKILAHNLSVQTGETPFGVPRTLRSDDSREAATRRPRYHVLSGNVGQSDVVDSERR